MGQAVRFLALGLYMQNRRAMSFGLLLLLLSMSFVWAKSTVVVGMVTETQGKAYWQNDNKKNSVQALGELPKDAKLVLTKGSKLAVVYLESGQQYQLLGPGLVQFKKQQPIALTGTPPKKIGAAVSVTQSKIRIKTKKVQTAAQTLVSNEKQGVKDMPIVTASAPPPPMPPPMPMPSPTRKPIVVSEVAASTTSEKRDQEYKAAMAKAMVMKEAEMAAAKATSRQAETELLTEQRAQAAAAAAARVKQMADAAKAEEPQSGCLPTEAIDKKVQTDEKEKKTTGTVVGDCPMITF